MPHQSLAEALVFQTTETPPLLASRSVPFRETAGVKWLLMAVDVAALETSVAVGVILRILLAGVFTQPFAGEQFGALVFGVLLIPAIQYHLKLYPGYCLGPVEQLRIRVYTTIAVFVGLMAWDSMVLRSSLSRVAVAVAFLLALVVPIIVNAFVRAALIRRKKFGEPVVILGAGKTGVTTVKLLKKNPNIGLVPVCLLDDDALKWGVEYEGVPVIGAARAAGEAAQLASAAIVAIPSMNPRKLSRVLGSLRFSRLIVIPDLFGMQSQWVTPRDLGGYLGLEIKNNLHVPYNRKIKRALDLALTVPGALASLPLIAMFALWIKRASPGSAFYTQEREGLGGKPIRVWKLRTMHPNAEQVLQQHLDEHPEARAEWMRFFKLKNDPRIIRGVGRLLRRTSLDELPQLWNVIKGEMSLVGPRPFPTYHNEQFTPDFRALRCSVMPGVTGFWQVSDRSNGDTKVQETLDSYYVRNWSLWLDIYLTVQTFQAVISGRGAY